MRHLLLGALVSISLPSAGQVAAKPNNVPVFDTIEVSRMPKEFGNLVFFRRQDTADQYGMPIVPRPKSSLVDFTFINDSANTIQQRDWSVCTASLKGDSLIIRVGASDGRTGYSINIKCVGNLFTSVISRFSHNDSDAQSRLHISTEKQMLFLNKASYAVGDSLFGSIYTRQIDNKGLKSYASGLFRTIVGEPR